LGDEGEGRGWLEKALAFAEEHGLSKLIFDAEAALKEVSSGLASGTARTVFQDPAPEEVLGVRRGLREMRETQAAVGGLV
jgi:hypothetical protein